MLQDELSTIHRLVEQGGCYSLLRHDVGFWDQFMLIFTCLVLQSKQRIDRFCARNNENNNT